MQKLLLKPLLEKQKSVLRVQNVRKNSIKSGVEVQNKYVL
jgi:hypothetical protein